MQANPREALPLHLQSLLLDLHNEFFTDSKTFLLKLETLLFDIPLQTSPELLAKMTSLLIFDGKTQIFKYLLQRIADKDRLSSNFRKGLLETLRKYMKKYHKSLSMQALTVIKTNCLQLFQTDISAAVKEGALSPIISLVKMFPKENIKLLIQPEKLVDLLLKNIRDIKHNAGARRQIWHLLGLLCWAFPRELDNYKVETLEICYMEVISQVETKNKPEITVIEGSLKALYYLLFENYLTAQQLSKLFNILKVLIVPIADVHHYLVMKQAIRCLSAHCSLFSQQIIKEFIPLLDLIIQLFSLINRKIRENTGELLESLTKLVVSTLDASQESHKILFKEILDRLLGLIDQKDIVLMSSGIRALGHYSRSVRIFRSEAKVRELFKQMLEFSQEKVLFPLETSSRNENSLSQASTDSSFKTVLFLQKQVFSFLNAFCSLIQNLSNLKENETQGLFELCLLAIKQNKNFFASYKPLLYDSLVQLFLSVYQHHSSLFIPWTKRLINFGMFESLKIPENVVLAGEDYHISLKVASEFWQAVIMRDSIWTQSSRDLFLSCFLQEIEGVISLLELSYTVQRIESPLGVETVYIPNNQDHQQYLYRLILLLDDVLRKLVFIKGLEEILTLWLMSITRASIAKLRVLPRTLALYKMLNTNNQIFEELKTFELRALSADFVEFRGFLLNFYQELAYSNIKEFQEELLQEALKSLISIPTALVLSSETLKSLVISHLKQAFSLTGPQSLVLLSLALESLEKLVNKTMSFGEKGPFLKDLLQETLPFLGNSLFIEVYSLNSLDKKQLFTLSLRELSLDLDVFHEKTLDFLGKIGTLSHNILQKPTKSSENSSTDLIIWDFDSSLTFAMPLTSKKIELPLQSFLPRLLSLLKEAPSVQLQTTAGEFLHAVLIYMIGKSSSSHILTEKKRAARSSLPSTEPSPSIRKKTFAIIYQRIFPVLFSLAADPSHPCAKLLHSLSLQTIRWLANTREHESPDLVVLIDSLMRALAHKEDSSLREFAFCGLHELLKWTVKQRTHQELEADAGVFRALVKRIASLVSHPDQNQRFAALLTLKALVMSYKDDSSLAKRFARESFGLTLRAAKTDLGESSTGSLKEVLNFVVESHENWLSKLGVWKSEPAVIEEIMDLALRPENVLRDVSLKLITRMIRSNLIKINDLLNHVESKALLQSPLAFVNLNNLVDAAVLVKNHDVFVAQIEFWQIVSKFLGFKVLELKDFIKSCHNIRGFVDSVSGKAGAGAITEKLMLKRVSAFQKLLSFLVEIDALVFQALFKTAFQIGPLLQAAFVLLLGSSEVVNICESLAETMVSSIKQLLEKSLEKELQTPDNISEIVNFIVKNLGFLSPQSLALAVFKCEIPIKKAAFWLKAVKTLFSLGNCCEKAFLEELLDTLQKESENNGSLPEKETLGARVLLSFLLDFVENFAVQSFVLECFLRQNVLFQRFEPEFLGFLSQSAATFAKALELMPDSVELLGFLLPISQQVAISQRSAFFPIVHELLHKELSAVSTQLSHEKLWIFLRLAGYLLETSINPAKEAQFLKVLLPQALKYPQVSLKIALEAFEILGRGLKASPNEFSSFMDQISMIQAGIFSLSSEVTPQSSENKEILKKNEIPEAQDEGKINTLKALATGLCEMVKSTGSVKFLVKILLPLQRVSLISKRIKSTVSTMLAQELPLLSSQELRQFLESLLEDFFDNSQEIVHESLVETLTKVLENIQENSQDLIVDLASKATPIMLSLLKETLEKASFVKKSQCFKVFETFYETLSLENIRENLHKKLYGVDTSKNELTKNLIELSHSAKKNRFFEHPAPKERVIYCQNAYNCLMSVIKKTQSKENVFNQFLFAVNRDKNEEIWSNILDFSSTLAFEVRTSFKQESFAKEPAKNLNKIPLKSTKILLKTGQSFYSQSQSLLFQTPFLPEVLQLQNNPNEIPQKAEAFPEKPEISLEMDPLNSHPCMKPLLQVLDHILSKFQANEQPAANSPQPSWMQSLYLEVCRKEVEPLTWCFLIKIVMNRAAVFKNFRKYWYSVILDVIAEKKTQGKGLHYFMRDAAMLLIDWGKDLPLQALFPSNNVGNKEKETLCRAANNLVKILADENKEIFRSNLEIFEQLLEKWAPCVFLERSVVFTMLSLEEKPDNSQNKTLFLYKYLAASLLELALAFKIPLLKDFQEFLSLGGLGGILSPQAFSAFSDPAILKELLKVLVNKKKIVALASITTISRLFKEVYSQETQESCNKKREALNRIMMDIYSSDRKRYSLLVKEIVVSFPDFLRTRETFGKTLDLLTIGAKKEKAEGFKALRIYVQTHNDRLLIENDLKDFCLSLQASLDKVLADSEEETQQEMLTLLSFLANLLHLPFVKTLFEESYQRISSRCLMNKLDKTTNKELLEEKFIEMSIKLLDSLKGFQLNSSENGRKNLLELSIKRSLLSCLSLESTKSLKTRVFNYFEKEQSLSQAPNHRLLALLKELYDPEHEEQWLTSAMPLLISLAKESSDYERVLFEEPLAESVKFYDFDFRNPQYLQQANRTQPLTPVFSLSLSQNANILASNNENNPNNNNNNANIVSNSNFNNNEAFIRQTVEFPSTFTYKDPVAASQLFNQRKNQAFPGENPQKPGVFSQNVLPNSSNNPANLTMNSGFLRPSRKQKPTSATQKMSLFFAENLVDFSQTSQSESNKLRFHAEKRLGARITSLESIRARQAQLFEARLNEQRRNTVTALRKYRIGELPDIEIKAKDLIDPLQGLCFKDQEISAEVFLILFTGLYREESSEDTKNALKDALFAFLKNTKYFTKRLMTTVHRILYIIGKKSQVLWEIEPSLIKETGIRGGSLFTSALLLEESLIQGNEAGDLRFSLEPPDRLKIEGNRAEKGLNIRENADLWLNLLEVYRQLKEKESIEGIMSTLLSKEYNEDELRDALDHKLRGNYRLALKYFEQKLSSSSSLLESEANAGLKSQVFAYMKTEQQYCYALLGKWESLSSLYANEGDEPVNASNSAEQTDLWIYSQLAQGKAQETLAKLAKNSAISEENFGYEMSVLTLFQLKPDLENARHWLSFEKKAFLSRFRSLGSFSEPAKIEMLDKLQRVFELKEYISLLKVQENESAFSRNAGNLLAKWTSRASNLQAETQENSVLSQYKAVLVRELCIQRLLGAEITGFSTEQKEKLSVLALDSQISLASALIKLGLLDSGDSFLMKALNKRPKDFFSWGLIKTIAKLKIQQANRTNLKDWAQISGNFQQIANVLEKQREKFKGLIVGNVEKKFNVYIRKCYEGLIDLICTLCDFSLDSLSREHVLTATKHVFFQGFQEIQGLIINGNEKSVEKGSKDIAFIRKEAMNFALFCSKLLKIYEKNEEFYVQAAKNQAFLYDSLAENFLKSLSLFFSLGGKDDQLLLKLITLVERRAESLGVLFKSCVAQKKIPAFYFLQWLPQMMHLLTKPAVLPYFQDVFLSLAHKFPQAFMYPFHVNHQRLFEETRENTNCPALLLELKEILCEKFPGFSSFAQGLNLLTYPEHRLAFYQAKVLNLLKDLEENYSQIALKDLLPELQALCQDLYFDVLNDEKDCLLGKYNEKFARSYKKQFLDAVGGSKFSVFSSLGSKSAVLELRARLLKFFKPLPEALKALPGGGLEKLEGFSRFLALYSGELAIEVPGQYNKSPLLGEPCPQYHVQITGFEQSILTLESLRRPKRLVFYGSDEKSYKFLVKGVEDLRLDQRIEQFFCVMNAQFARDLSTRERSELKLATFEVIPVSKSLGLLQWLENTSPVKEILEKELKSLEGNAADLKSQNKAFQVRMAWISAFNSKLSAQENSKRLLYLDQKTIEDAFVEHERLIPRFLLRNSLEKLSLNHEAFFLLKAKVIRNLAAVSAACYVLGIGDRHLENFLINWKSGELIAIDFGYSFGAGVRLSIPELLPFRLTRVFEALTLPVGTAGLLRQSLILLMKSLRKTTDFLLEIAEAFVKDPLLDFTACYKEKSRVLSAGDGVSEEQAQDTGSLLGQEGKKLDFMRKKLLGVASWKIMLEELEVSRHAKEGYKAMVWDAVKGGAKKSRAGTDFEGFLEVSDQVDCLLDHARDKNLLGRTWIGWTPYV